MRLLENHLSFPLTFCQNKAGSLVQVLYLIWLYFNFCVHQRQCHNYMLPCFRHMENEIGCNPMRNYLGLSIVEHAVLTSM